MSLVIKTIAYYTNPDALAIWNSNKPSGGISAGISGTVKTFLSGNLFLPLTQINSLREDQLSLYPTERLVNM